MCPADSAGGGVAATVAVSDQYGRMFDEVIGREDGPDLDWLARPDGPMDTSLLQSKVIENVGIPAAFTYFGQLLAHDLSYDSQTWPSGVGRDGPLRNLHTPRADLDCVYGGGPSPRPELYEERDQVPGYFRLGDVPQAEGFGFPDDGDRGFDFAGRGDRVLLADSRNDDNLILAQLVVAFMRFHNAVMDGLGQEGSVAPGARFERAQQLVRWHYQWIILNEYLPTLVDAGLLADIRDKGRRLFKPGETVGVPMEFALAALRVGHSMVRWFYEVRSKVEAFSLIPATPARSKDFRGGAFDSKYLIDWSLLLPMPHSVRKQYAAQFSPRVSPGLLALPSGRDGSKINLLASDLKRAKARSLGSGIAVAKAAATFVPELEVLSRRDVWGCLGQATPGLEDFEPPLLIYLLAEAELKGKWTKEIPGDACYLGPLGGRLLAEVVTGLIELDPTSMISQPGGWVPDLGSAGQFSLADLLRMAKVMGS